MLSTGELPGKGRLPRCIDRGASRPGGRSGHL